VTNQKIVGKYLSEQRRGNRAIHMAVEKEPLTDLT